MPGKTKEEIAFELVSKLKGVGVWGENNMQQILDMYAQCLEATSGLRPMDGVKPSAVRLAEAGSSTPKTQAALPHQQVSAAPQQAAPLQRAPMQQPQVRQQQQMVQQAYQQQPTLQTRG